MTEEEKQAWALALELTEMFMKKELSLVKTQHELDQVRSAYLGKNGIVNDFFRILHPKKVP